MKAFKIIIAIIVVGIIGAVCIELAEHIAGHINLYLFSVTITFLAWVKLMIFKRL